MVLINTTNRGKEIDTWKHDLLLKSTKVTLGTMYLSIKVKSLQTKKLKYYIKCLWSILTYTLLNVVLKLL